MRLCFPSARIPLISFRGFRGECRLTGQKPYHSTSASAPSSSYQACTAAGPAHTSQSSHHLNEPGTAYHLPKIPTQSAHHSSHSPPKSNWARTHSRHSILIGMRARGIRRDGSLDQGCPGESIAA